MTAVSDDIEQLQIDPELGSESSTDNDFPSFAADQPGDTLQFYEIEVKILALWDQLNDLKLEIALQEAQNNPDSVDSSNLSDEDVEAELEKAEQECLDARAGYMLRQSIVEDTIIAGPILNAIHAGDNATATERALGPLLDRRDVLEIASTNLAAKLQATTSKRMQVETENITTIASNRDLATQLLALINDIEERRASAKEASGLKETLATAEEEAAIARKRWRIMKNVVAAMVAGSGIDWSQDETLRDLVLDNGNDAG